MLSSLSSELLSLLGEVCLKARLKADESLTDKMDQQRLFGFLATLSCSAC